MTVKYGYESGIKAIRKQIYPAMLASGADWNDEVFEELTFALLTRTCPGWLKR